MSIWTLYSEIIDFCVLGGKAKLQHLKIITPAVKNLKDGTS